MTDQEKTEAELEADVERDRSAWADECTLPLMGQSIYRKANAAGSYAQSCEALINHLKTSLAQERDLRSKAIAAMDLMDKSEKERRRDYARRAFEYGYRLAEDNAQNSDVVTIKDMGGYLGIMFDAWSRVQEAEQEKGK